MFLYKNKKIKIKSNYDLISNTVLHLLYFKKIKLISSAVAYKNRFLIYKRSSKMQFVGLFINKGFRIKSLKLINKFYLNFLYSFNNLNYDDNYLKNFNDMKFNYGEFINLYNAFSFFKDWSRVLLWRVDENLPLIKVISKKSKSKKKKKKKKKNSLWNLNT